jgi:hypothetical protein
MIYPPSSIIRSVVHRAMTCLIFLGEVGKLGGNNFSELGGGMWLWGAGQLVLWVFYNKKPIRQHSILSMTTLETQHIQYLALNLVSMANDPCRICYRVFYYKVWKLLKREKWPQILWSGKSWCHMHVTKSRTPTHIGGEFWCGLPQPNFHH